jgi:hypothetical protein
MSDIGQSTDPSTVTQTDALGGAGSLESGLASVAVNGLSRLVDGALSTKYPLTAFNEPYAVEGGGAYEPGVGLLVPRSAPQRGFGPTQAAVPFYQNPVVLGVGGAVLVAVVLIFALKK